MDSRDQENLLPNSSQDFPPSSPLVARSAHSPRSSTVKPRKPPTVTPRRFTRFFTPRGSSRPVNSQSARQLREISANAANRTSGLHFEDSHRFSKRRKLSVESTSELASSPLPYSSPLKPPPVIEDDEYPSEPVVETASFPHRIQRGKVWDRYEIPKPDTRHITADFVSGPEDSHGFGELLPFCVSASHSSSVVAIGDEGGTVSLIDASDEAHKYPFATSLVNIKAHGNAILDVAFSEDDLKIATASGDQTCRIVDAQTQITTHILAGHSNSVKQVAFRPNGNANILASSARDGLVGLWDLRIKSRQSLVFTMGADPTADDSTRLTINLYDFISVSFNPRTPPTSFNRDRGQTTSILFPSTSQSHHILTSSDNNAQLRLWDIRARYSQTRSRFAPAPVSTTAPLPHHVAKRHYGVTSLALSEDGSRIYALAKDSHVYAYATSHLILGQTPSHPRSTGHAGAGPVCAFACPSLRVGSFYARVATRRDCARNGPDMLALGGNNGVCLIPTDPRVLARQQPSTVIPSSSSSSSSDAIRRAAASEDASTAASAAAAEPLPVYSLGTLLRGGHDGGHEVTGVAWAANGALVSVGDDCAARRWTESRTTKDAAREFARRSAGIEEYGVADVGSDWDSDDG